ncbi:MAG TPA: beta-N-acetylglucosaminidase domain-containing protein [Candidatus Polarisedimenticolaceae bacterium]|nr:beta-N-acetylglucosaminidase domain-containing protein [Candidatus Polarisedimenticolaceae bacterium]
MTRGARALTLVAVLLLGVALDQALKAVAFGALTSPVSMGVVQLRAIANKGAILGMGSGLGETARRLVFTIAEGALLAALGAYALLARSAGPLEVWAIALVIAGGAGNVVDRIVFGYVRDYVLIGRPGWPTAAFNLADVAVVLGFTILLVAAWRGARPKTKAAAAMLVLTAALAPEANASEPFPLRMVKLGGMPADPSVKAHVSYCRSLGFNAFFVYSHQAGAWTERAHLDRDFVTFARAMKTSGVALWVSINPVADTRNTFVFSDGDGERKLLAFMKKLHAKAGVDRFILSFDDQPTKLHELRDIFRYGFSSAPAHLDLAARIAAKLPKGTALWLCAAAYADVHLGDGSGPYSAPFLEGVPKLSPSIGIVWTGPDVLSPKVTRADLEKTRARLGGRPLLLYDNFPVNDDETGDALGLILGALRNREPSIRDEVAGYLACPMNELGASRFPLATTAAFLNDPEGYDADREIQRLLDRFSNREKETRTALDTQVLEWGGFIGERNYWPRDLLNAADAGRRLDDPAFVESFTWTADRYPGRMLALAAIEDGPFREDLLMVMRRRLAVARAMPLVIEYLARARAGRSDAAAVLQSIEQQRHDLLIVPDAHDVLDVFLRSARIPIR